MLENDINEKETSMKRVIGLSAVAALGLTGCQPSSPPAPPPPKTTTVNTAPSGVDVKVQDKVGVQVGDGKVDVKVNP